MGPDDFEDSFASAESLWVPAEFRAWRARQGISLQDLRQALVDRLGELGVPSISTISQSWARDGSPGPRNLTIVYALAEILGCSVRALMCPVPLRPPLDDLIPTQSEISTAMQVMQYVAAIAMSHSELGIAQEDNASSPPPCALGSSDAMQDPAPADSRVLSPQVSNSTAYDTLSSSTAPPDPVFPEAGSRVPDSDLANRFGLERAPTPIVPYAGGDGFLLLTGTSNLPAPDRCDLALRGSDALRNVHVLVRSSTDAAWYYSGLATQEGPLWSFPALPYSIWCEELEQSGVSRTSSRRSLIQAKQLTKYLLTRQSELETLGVRILLRHPKGGLKIDGGPNGFQARTVTLTDIAWALEAKAHAELYGVLLDYTLVSRLRYLEGTPEAATRLIDSGYALALVEAARGTA